MTALSLILASRVLFFAADEPAAARELVLFVAPAQSSSLDVRAVLDAVAIYTRDLGIRVEETTEAGGPPSPERRDELAALLRARGARLIFWCEPEPDGGAIGLYSLDADGVIRIETVRGSGPQGPDLLRAIALKLRAILVKEQNRGSPESASTAAGPTVVATVPAPPAPAPGRGPFLVVEYALSLTPGQGGVRQGIGLQGTRGVGRSFEIALGLEAASPADGSVATGTVSLYDVPLRLGGRWLRRGSRLAGGVGAYGAAHGLLATATSIDGRRDRTFTAAGGLGVEALGRGLWAGPVGLELRFWAERIVPRTRFLVGGTPAVSAGPFMVGVALGLTFSTR